MSTARRSLGALLLVAAVAGFVGVVEGAVDLGASDQPTVRLRAFGFLAYAVAVWVVTALVCVVPGLVLAVLMGRLGSVASGAGLGIGLWAAAALLLDDRGIALTVGVGWVVALLATWAFRVLLDRRPVRRGLAALGLAGLAFGLGGLAAGERLQAPRSLASPPPAPAPRGLVVIVVDALRADALSCYGGGHPTPHIDGLGAQGWRVADVLGSSSWTLPAVASLWTAEPPRRHGVNTYDAVLPEELPLLADHVAAQGWMTAAVVSNALLDPRRGFGRGFDVYWCDTRQTEASLFWILRAHRWLLRQGLISGPNAAAKPVLPTWTHRDGLGARRAGYLAADEVTARALRVLDAVGEAPFLLYLHYYDPHDPYLPHPHPLLFDEPPFEAATRGRLTGLYAGEVAFLDEQIGRLLAGMGERGLLEHVVVALTADHGEEFGDHGGWRHKGTLYDELVRLPLLVRFPGGIAPSPAPAAASLSDLAPTLLAAAGLPPLPGGRGRDLLAGPGAPVRFAERIQDGIWLVAARTEARHWIARLPRDLEITDDDLARWRARLAQPPPPLVRWTLDGELPFIVPPAARAVVGAVEGGGPDGTRALRLAAADGDARPQAVRSVSFELGEAGVVSAALTAQARGPAAGRLRLFLERQGAGGWTRVEGSERTVEPTAEPRLAVTPARRTTAGTLRLVVKTVEGPSAGSAWIVDDVRVVLDDPRLVFEAEVYERSDERQQRNLFDHDDPEWTTILEQLLTYASDARDDAARPLDEEERERLRAMGYLK